MPDLSVITALEPLDPDDPAGGLRWNVPDGWQVAAGGAWGGLSVAAMCRAALAAESDSDRRVRSLSAQIVAPVRPGPKDLRTEPLRIGAAMSHRRVTITDAGAPERVVAHGVAVLGARRAEDLDTSGPAWRGVDAPDSPPFHEVPVVPIGPPLGPGFGPHLEFRPLGGLPGSGVAEDVLCWIRLAEPAGDAPYDDVTVLALIDALWPAGFTRVSPPRPMATVTFEAAVVGDPAALDPGAPLLHRGRVLAAREGYVVETRELWSPAGDLVVTNVQTMAIVR